MNEPLSLAHLVRGRADTNPDLDVLTFETDGHTRVRTYGALWTNALRLADAFSALGISRSDGFGLLLYNEPEFIESMIAANVLGAVFVPLDPRLRGDRLAFMVADAGCRGVVCGADAVDAVLAVAPQVPSLEWVMVVGGAGHEGVRSGVRVVHAPDAANGAPPMRDIAVRDSADPMQIMYTSGTTGDPKGIVVPHARFVAATAFGRELFDYRPDDRPYTGLSLTHGNAQFVTVAPALGQGLRAVISRRFTKSRLWDVIREHGCTTFSLLGGMATAIYSEPPSERDRDNPVRHVVSAGMPAAVWEAFRTRFGVDIIEFYAAMEGGMALNRAGEGPVGSCGRVVPQLIGRVLDPDGQELPSGTVGELCFRYADGSPIPVQYLGNPEASAAKTVGGWLHSGDAVVMDADGWVYYRHRMGGGIRRNGEFLDPARIERTVAECPEVSDVFVYGVPAASGAPGEREPVAAILPADPASFDPQAVFTWCRERLEPSHAPAYVQIVNDIPKTASQKPQERFLRQMFDQHPDRVEREIARAGTVTSTGK
ncbi:AMP-binding protein [Streptomyces sp. UG1]|uniref:AMP-binding protein n=1 Tax=Streptomyces sp. UG1 TaxID=3417652 RepID=UPI003CF07D23